jgi:CelD/BcsL family acetyltransferase involved in cellulose biosynthesis
MRAEVVEQADALAALAPDWRRLAERRGNVFVSPEWSEAWLGAFPSERPFVLAVRDGDSRLRGVLPLMVASGRPRTLHFAGAALGDDFHPAAASGDERDVAAAAGAVLRERRNEWSVIALENVTAGDVWTRRLAAGLSTLARPADAHLEIALDGLSWDEYLAGRSSSFRKAVRREERALGAEHDLRYRRTTSVEELDEDLATFFALHDLRWAERRGSTLNSAPAREFVRRLAHAALAAGWLRLWFLELDGRAVAAWLGWRVGDRYAHYQSGRDPGFRRHSPGFLLQARTVRDACEEGAAVYDLLAGAESYKRRFATSEHATTTLLVTRRLHPARLLVTTEIVLRRVSAVLPPTLRDHAKRGARRFLGKLPTTRSS